MTKKVTQKVERKQAEKQANKNKIEKQQKPKVALKQTVND